MISLYIIIYTQSDYTIMLLRQIFLSLIIILSYLIKIISNKKYSWSKKNIIIHFLSH